MSLKHITNKLIADFSGELFLSKKQAAMALSVSITTIDNYRLVNQLKTIKRGQKIMFSVQEIARTMRDGIDATGVGSIHKKIKGEHND